MTDPYTESLEREIDRLEQAVGRLRHQVESLEHELREANKQISYLYETTRRNSASLGFFD